MNDWNPFGKVDMEIGSFLKASVFNKEYENDSYSEYSVNKEYCEGNRDNSSNASNDSKEGKEI